MLKHVPHRSSSTSFNRKSDSCRNSVISKRLSFKSDFDDSFKHSHGRLYHRNSISDDFDDTLSLRNFGDNVSLSSTLSYASISRGSVPESRYSSSLSLADGNPIPVKVFLRKLRADMEYKTLPLSSATTCRQMITHLLHKFRLRHRDPNLFYVTMEVVVKGGTDATQKTSVLVLDDYSRPAELQQCRPKGEARFSVEVRPGGLVRVHDSVLMQGSQYKSLLLSHHTNASELVQLVLSCYHRTDNPNMYSIHEVCQNPYYDRPLSPESMPLDVQAKWPKNDGSAWSFVLRRNIIYSHSLKAKLPWRRSLDQSSTDTESEEDHNTTRASIMSSCSTSSGVSSSSLASVSSGGSDDCYMSTPLSSPMKLPRFIGSNAQSVSPDRRIVLWRPKHSTPNSSSSQNIYINIEPSPIAVPDKNEEPVRSSTPETPVLPAREVKLPEAPLIPDRQPTPVKETPVPSASLLIPHRPVSEEVSVTPLRHSTVPETPPIPERPSTSNTPVKSASVVLAGLTLSRATTGDSPSTPVRHYTLPATLTRQVSPETPVPLSRRQSLPETPRVPHGSRPPKPVPRTLFLPLRSKSLTRDVTEDSGYITESPVTPEKKPKTYGILSRSNPKKASIRSLSKSFANLNLIASKPPRPSTPKKLNKSPSQSSMALSCSHNCQSCFYI